MSRFSEKPVAIIGMGCRLPGADNVDEFWQLLIEGRSALGELPPDRMDRELQYSPQKGNRTRSYSCLGGVAQEQQFPQIDCPVSQSLIDQSHSAHITLCTVAASACRDAGLNPYALPNRNVGVYVGHTPPSAHIGQVVYARMIAQTAEYLREIRDLDQLPPGEKDAIIREIVHSVRKDYKAGDPLTRMRSYANHAPGLISQAFGLDGPSIAFDAACASSFRALGHGIRALQRGAVDMALIGGASYVHGDTLVVFSQAQTLSTVGSMPFDEKAAGLVAAGGYVVLALKTLERAMADGDSIQAVICGLGVSSDGKGKSLWAPRQEGQIEAISRAYGHGIEFRDLQYLEMHATSTQVGDATELAAMAKSAHGQFPPHTKIPIGSVKANIGHTLETAGIASLLKTVLAMKHGKIPPQINVQQLNSTVNWEELPFFVPTQALEWKRPAPNIPRMAAVNAFGIGGLNVHIALREHLAVASSTHPVSSPPVKQLMAAKDDNLNDERALAIVGMGAIYPGARTIDHLWDVFREGRDQKSEVAPQRWGKNLAYEAASHELWKVPTATGGFINDYEYDWKRHKVPPKQIASADPLQFMLLDAADQALKDSGYDAKPFDRNRTGVIVGIVFGGEFADQLQAGLRLTDFQKRLSEALQNRGVAREKINQICAEYENILLQHMPALIDETGSFTASTLASRITKTFNLMGGAVALDAGDCSSLSAIECCADVLLAGDCDMMICASGQRAMGIPTFEGLKQHELLSVGEPHAPFDSRATGSVPGEGVGAVILKRLADAQRDGDRIHGIIRGLGVARSDSRREALRNALSRGLHSAGLTPQDIAFIEAGSSGVPDRDRDEILAIADVYGAESRPEPMPIGSVAGQMGNIGGGSGMASLIKAVSQLNHVEMSASVGLESPISELGDNAKTVRPCSAPSRIPPVHADGRLFAGITSYANHHVAYHLIVEGATRVPMPTPSAKRPSLIARPAAQPCDLRSPAASPGSPRVSSAWQPESSRWRIVRWSGNSLSELQQQATASAVNPTFAFEAAINSCYDVKQRYRLAIVAENAETLSTKLTLAAKQLANSGAQAVLAEKGIFVGKIPEVKPLVAFLFPGQGSQYEGMLKSLTDECPAAAATLREIDSILARLQLPSFADLAWNVSNELGDDVWKTQLSLLIADTIVYSAVISAGIRADRVAGHSFGELAALVAAGSWTFEDALIATSGRCEAIDACRNANGLLVSTNAGASIAENICRENPGQVSVSHFNAPEQTVIGGEASAIQQVAEALKAQGFLAKILNVPAAFHTPLMEEVKIPFGRFLKDIPLSPPSIPLLSSVTNRYVADPVDIRDNLVLQMTRPVNYVDLATRLADEGIAAMVEVGPRQVLTGLHRQILNGRTIAIVGCDHPKRNGMEQLLYVRVCLEVIGATDVWPEKTLPQIFANAAPAIELPLNDQAAMGQTEPVAVNINRSNPETSLAASDRQIVDHFAPSAMTMTGTSFEMGQQHGVAYAKSIRTVLRRCADLAGSAWDELAKIDDAVAQAEHYFGAAGLEEIRGIADGAGVAVGGLIALNLRLYLNACAGGLHFAVSTQANPAGEMLHAMNEDLARGLKLKDCLVRSIQLRRPVTGIAHMTFGIAGQIGTLSGINAHGLTVSTASLVDVAPENIQTSGLLITVVIRNILEQTTDLDSAVALLRSSRLTGAWTLCLSHQATDRVCFVEFDGQGMRVQPQLQRAMAANHQQLMNHTRQSFTGNAPAHSSNRLNRLRELLDATATAGMTVDKAKTVLRDRFDQSPPSEAELPGLHTIQRIDTQISLVMQPAEAAVWVTGGPTSNGFQNQFTRISLQNLLLQSPAEPAVVHAPSAPSGKNRAGVNSEIQQKQLSEDFANAADPVLPDGTVGVCSRFVMRMVRQPLAAGENKSLGPVGNVVILGQNRAGQALRDKLTSQGVTAFLLPVNEDPSVTIAALENLWKSAPAPHLFLMTAMDEQAQTALESEVWRSRTSQGVMLPYLVCQRWFQLMSGARLLSQGSLIAATSMGGDFGFSGNIRGVEGGALTGLVKGVHLELEMGHHETQFHARIVDSANSTSPKELARYLCRELAVRDDEIEVGYMNGMRYVVRPVVETVGKLTSRKISPGANVLITGGARGITAVVARELGLQFGARLQLIGSSPIPEIPDAFRNSSEELRRELKAIVMKEALADGRKPIEAWEHYEKALELDRTLRDFSDAGIHATYHACDISDRAALSCLLETIRSTDGPIQGVIHGAGFERATRFDKKKPELVARTVAVKVDGAANLMALTLNDPVEFFAAFGSVSGRFGGVGQTDYCVANDMLAKLVDWYRQTRPGTVASTFHWHAWDDVGMAMRPESKHIRKMHDIRFMPSREGTMHLVGELRAGLPEGEILVTELKTCRDRYTRIAPATEGATSTTPAKLPLIDAVISKIPGKELLAELILDPCQDVFLKQHLFKGKPLLPVVVAIEALVEAAIELTGKYGKVAALHNIEIVNGLRFTTDEPQTAHVRAVADGNQVRCELMCDFRNRRGIVLQPNRPYLRADVVFMETPPKLASCTTPSVSEWHDVWYPEEDVVIYHGPVFRNLRQITVDERSDGWARLVAPSPDNVAGVRGGAGWCVPSALLDGCFFACGAFLWFLLEGVVAIPAGIGEIRFGRQARVGEQCLAHIRFRDRKDDQGIFDVDLYGEDGEAILQVEGYRNMIVAQAISNVR